MTSTLKNMLDSEGIQFDDNVDRFLTGSHYDVQRESGGPSSEQEAFTTSDISDMMDL